MYFIHYFYYKNIGYVWRGIKTNPRLKNSTAPPGFEIPGSATGSIIIIIYAIYLMFSMWSSSCRCLGNSSLSLDSPLLESLMMKTRGHFPTLEYFLLLKNMVKGCYNKYNYNRVARCKWCCLDCFSGFFINLV